MTTRVAITGYSFRLPGTTADTYWQDLLNGRDLVGEVPAATVQNIAASISYDPEIAKSLAEETKP